MYSNLVNSLDSINGVLQNNFSVAPRLYNPVGINNIIKVNGLDSAKAYATQPNSMIVLFDGNEDLFYIKTTDANNFPTLRTFKFTEVLTKEIQNGNEFVTVDEFRKFKEEILNGKQHIRKSANAKHKHGPAKQYSADKKYDGHGEELSESRIIDAEFTEE